jgi:N-acetylglucosamine kinase-like BadF-type ATPase
LLPALLNHWQLQLPEDFITYLYGVSDPRPLLGDVGPVIMQIAAEHDAVATQIVHQAGFELARSVLAVAKQLELPRPLPLALAGSMIVRGEPLQRALVEHLASHGLAVAMQLVDDPAVGALRLAQRIAVGERQLKGEWQAF